MPQLDETILDCLGRAVHRDLEKGGQCTCGAGTSEGLSTKAFGSVQLLWDRRRPALRRRTTLFGQLKLSSKNHAVRV